jgi:hypothetical protein
MANGKVQWAQTFGGGSTGLLLGDVAFSADGKGIALGGGYSSTTFPIALTPAIMLGGGTPDVLVGDFDTTGAATNGFGSVANNGGTTQTSAVVVAGEMGIAANGTSSNIAIIKLDATNKNKVIFDEAFGGPGTTTLGGMALNPKGGVVLTGSFTGKAVFGSKSFTSKGANDIFVLQLDTSGNVTSALPYGDTGDDEAVALALDASGNIVLTGTTTSTNLDLGCGNQPTPTNTPRSGYVGLLGATVCKVSFTSGGAFTPTSVAVDPAGGAVAGGFFTGTVNFGGTMLTGPTGAFSAGGVLWSIGPDGATTRFAKSYGTTGLVLINSVAVDPSSDVVAGGFFIGTAELGSTTTYSATTGDGFVLKTDSSGKSLWDVHFGDATGDAIHGVAVDQSGNIAAVGNVNGATSLVAASPAGGSTGAGTAGVTSGLLLEISP